MVFESLQGILGEMFSVEEDEITTETDFYTDLFADSLDMLELWYILEEEFELNDIDKAKMTDFRTVGQIVDYIN